MRCSVWQENLADKAPSIGVNAEPSEGCRQNFNLLLIEWRKVVEFPLFDRSQGHFGRSYVLESMLYLICCFEHYEVSLYLVEIFHSEPLESHKKKVVVELAKFSAFRLLLFCDVGF
jgi:hypothetical protein